MTEVGEQLQAAKPHLLAVLTDPQSEGQGATIRPIGDLVAEADGCLEDAYWIGTKDETLAAVETFTAQYRSLGIVNPDKRKFATTVLNETYYELIRRLANELEKENSVLFVHGFSFRDEHLRDLVLRAARTNPTLQVIVFCYSREGLQSYEQFLPDAEVKNGNIEFVVPAKPGDGEEDQS